MDHIRLSLHLELPWAQIELLLRYLLAYAGNPSDEIGIEVSIDARLQVDRGEVVALLIRAGFPLIAESFDGTTLTGMPLEDPDA